MLGLKRRTLDRWTWKKKIPPAVMRVNASYPNRRPTRNAVGRECDLSRPLSDRRQVTFWIRLRPSVTYFSNGVKHFVLLFVSLLAVIGTEKKNRTCVPTARGSIVFISKFKRTRRVKIMGHKTYKIFDRRAPTRHRDVYGAGRTEPIDRDNAMSYCGLSVNKSYGGENACARK